MSYNVFKFVPEVDVKSFEHDCPIKDNMLKFENSFRDLQATILEVTEAAKSLQSKLELAQSGGFKYNDLFTRPKLSLV